MSDIAGHIEEMALVQLVSDPYNDFQVSVLNSLRLTPSFGPIWYNDLDFGFPEIEGVNTAFSNRSGTFDETRYHRQRAVSLSLTVLDNWFPGAGSASWDQSANSSSYWIRQLGRWAVPSSRFALYWRNKGEENATYWMDIRGAGMTNAIAKQARDYREVQMNFINPSGRIYEFNGTFSVDSSTKDGRNKRRIAYGGSDVGALTLPITFPMEFPSSVSGDGPTIFYDGTIDTGFTARIYAGQNNDTYNARLTVNHIESQTEQSIGFQGPLDAPFGASRIPHSAAGSFRQFLEIDTSAMTVRLNADADSPQEKWLVAPLQWPQLKPGTNQVSFTTGPMPDGSESPGPDADSYIDILWYDAFLA